MASKSDMTQMLGLLIIVIVALALTPTIQTAVTDAAWAPFTDYKNVVPATSNSTSALTHPCRNGSATYFVVTLNGTQKDGRTTCIYITDFKDTTSTVITFYTLNSTVADYYCTIRYYWLSLDTASQALVALVPLMWVTLVLATLVVVIVYKLKFKRR